LSTVVMRPMVRQKVNILLLVDESEDMVPYRPIWQPVVDEMNRRLQAKDCYYFVCHNDSSLYRWDQPLRSLPLAEILVQMHPQTSVVVIVSDGGAVGGEDSPEALKSLQNLLEKLGRSARSLLWLNPVPEHLWADTMAMAVAKWLVQQDYGEMLPFETVRWQARGRSMRVSYAS
jgi:uncharacterized protein with von Willebrand factor type A (vWA) domain